MTPRPLVWKSPNHIKNGLVKICRDRFGHGFIWEDHDFVFLQFLLFDAQYQAESAELLNGFTAFLKWECESFEVYLEIIRGLVSLFSEVDEDTTLHEHRLELNAFLATYQPLSDLVTEKLKRKKKVE